MKTNKITRRSFLLGLGAVSAAAVLTACGSSSSTAASGAASGSTASAGGDTVYRTLDEIKADGTVNIGVFSDKNPFGYVTRTASIRATMSTSPTVWARIWVSR